jgi:membrane-bound lytic murein transglycosylase D
MQRRAFLLIPFLTVPLLAQNATIDLDELMKMGEKWARDNLDERWLQQFPAADQKQINQFVLEFQKRFQGEYVLDVAALRQTAKVVLPLLQSDPETRSYASWLKARMDYFEASEELRTMILAPKPGVPPSPPPKIPPTPTPQQEKTVWEKRVSVEQVPKNQQPYVARLKPIFTAQKIPAELVWLAEIESSFDPSAQSPVGAAGLYQLMPATAQEQGLSLKPKDQRFDPEKNAKAAATYLRKLHTKFKDWPLTLAAYNAGEGRVQQLLKKEKATSFQKIAPRLPAETQMYVPRFDATLKKREGVTLANLEKRRI